MMLYMLKCIHLSDSSMKSRLFFCLCTVTGLFSFSVTFAQDDVEEKKKPSWSTGLPERKSAPSMNTPSAEVEKPQFAMEQPASIDIPETDMALPAGLTQKFVMPEITIDNSAPEIDEPEVEYKVYTAIDSAMLNNYSWEIVEMEPVKIPKTLSFSYQEVMLEISINPQGRVVKVARVSDRTSNTILNYASKTIKKWRFKAPEDDGINGIVSKTMKVELLPRS